MISKVFIQDKSLTIKSYLTENQLITNGGGDFCNAVYLKV